jgi:hypothetical protein
VATFRGERGRIVWVYYDAAHVLEYVVAPLPTRAGWTLSARVDGEPNAYNLAEGRKRQALMFVASDNPGALRWPIVADSLAIADGRVTARLGTGPI